MIAALYVEAKGCYSGLSGVDPWDLARDARTYAGPWPVVAHPPCERWGRYSEGGPSHHGRFKTGDDGGCFAAALAAVRRFGGVLEHPADSKAWPAHGLNAPALGGWNAGDFLGGWVCEVEQGSYGHRARKRTWLYAFGVGLPSLRWGESTMSLPAQSDVSLFSRGRGAHTPNNAIERMCRRERLATPLAFRDLLIGIASSSTSTAAPMPIDAVTRAAG